MKTKIIVLLGTCVCLIGCSSKPMISSSLVSNSLLVYPHDEIPKRNDIGSISDDIKETINLDFQSCFNRLSNDKTNAVYSPLSFTITRELKRDNLENVYGITSAITVEKNRFSCSSINAIVRPWANAFNDQEISRFQSHGVSALSGPYLDLEEPLKQMFGVRIQLMPGFSTYVNQINLNDGLFEPWGLEARAFNGSENDTNYAYKSGDFLIYEDANCLAVKTNLSFSSLTLIMPKSDKLIHELDCFAIANSSFENLFCKVHVPEFKLSWHSSEKDLESIGEDRVIIQDTTFAFDRYGIKASSTTQNAPTSSNKEIRDIVFDKPFLFISAVDELPVYVGTVYQISI